MAHLNSLHFCPAKARLFVDRLFLSTTAFLLLACCGRAVAADEQLKLHTFRGENSLTITYRVSRNQILSEKNAWEPASRPFPVDLHACVVRAKQFLETTRETRAPLSFLNAAVHWRSIPLAGPFGEFVDRWYLILLFQSKTPEGKWIGGDELHVAMLLDGTIADPEIVSGKLEYPLRGQASGRPEDPLVPACVPCVTSSNQQMKAEMRQEPLPEYETLHQDPSGPIRLEHKARRSQVMSAKNAWNAMTEPFPGDLAAAITRSKEYLLGTREINHPIELGLTLIEYKLFLEQLADGERRPTKRWLIRTSFHSASPDGMPHNYDDLEVVTLLDGTIGEPRLLEGTLKHPFAANL